MRRREFIGMLAPAGGLSGCWGAPELRQWRGIAMGIAVSVQYRDERSELGLERALEAVMQAEKALTLWSGESALSRLNREGVLSNPPPALLACLEKSRELFEMSGGRFDPSVHSLWEWMRGERRRGLELEQAEVVRRLKRVDFGKVEFSRVRVTMPPGYALSFNAIAQGYLTDLFCENFSAASALVNFGEYRVLGGESWPVEVRGESYDLYRALAVSSGSGQRLSATSAANHLIDPETGGSPPPRKVVAVEAEEGWLADGLSTILAIGGEIAPGYDYKVIL